MSTSLIRLLWVEDEADTGMADRKDHIVLIGKYDIHFAKNATDAEYLISTQNFDVIIIDIRIPGGSNTKWSNEHIYSHNERLGALLIKKIGKQHPNLIRSIGIFSIELLENINPIMDNIISPEQYCYKGDSHYPEMFEEFIQQIFKRNQSR